MLRAPLLWMLLAGARASGTPADLDALYDAVAEASALEIDGPADGAASKDKQDRILRAQHDARVAANDRAEAVGEELTKQGSPEVQARVGVALGWMHLDMADTLITSFIPTYLTDDQRDLYQMALEDKAYPERERARHAALAAMGAAAPGTRVETDAWRLWLASGLPTTRPEALVCSSSGPGDPTAERSKRQRAAMAQLSSQLGHLSQDLETWRACLPPEVVEYADMVEEQARPVVDTNDEPFALDMLPFVEEISAQLELALPTSCGVSDHVPWRAPPPPPPPLEQLQWRWRLPQVAPIRDLTQLQSALTQGSLDPRPLLGSACPHASLNAELGPEVSALLVIELGAAELLRGPDGPLAHEALAAAFQRTAERTGTLLQPGEPDPKQRRLNELARSAEWAAARADAHLDALWKDAGTGREALETRLRELTRWRLHLQATRRSIDGDLRGSASRPEGLAWSPAPTAAAAQARWLLDRWDQLQAWQSQAPPPDRAQQERARVALERAWMSLALELQQVAWSGDLREQALLSAAATQATAALLAGARQALEGKDAYRLHQAVSGATVGEWQLATRMQVWTTQPWFPSSPPPSAPPPLGEELARFEHDRRLPARCWPGTSPDQLSALAEEAETVLRGEDPVREGAVTVLLLEAHGGLSTGWRRCDRGLGPLPLPLVDEPRESAPREAPPPARAAVAEAFMLEGEARAAVLARDWPNALDALEQAWRAWDYAQYSASGPADLCGMRRLGIAVLMAYTLDELRDAPLRSYAPLY